MANSLVLVHSPLVGPESWEPVGAVLAERGQNVQVADLTRALGLGPPYLPRMVEAIAALDSGPAFLVGHSRAGPLLPALGRAVGSVQGYIFVDTRLPHPGRSWMQAASSETVERLRAMEDDGWVAPWPAWWGDEVLAQLLPDPDVRERFVAGCPRLRVALFEEVYPTVPGWPDAGCAYLLLSDAYRQSAEESRALGWPVIEIRSNHLGLLTDPNLIATALIGLVGNLTDASRRERRQRGRSPPLISLAESS